MSKFKRFKTFAEAKEKGFADKNGLIPNQDIPKADKGPDLMKMKSEKPLGGRDYKGSMTTNPVKGSKQDPLPYKGFEKTDQKVGKGLLVNDEGDLKSGFAFKGNKVFNSPKTVAPLGEDPDMKNIEKVKHSKGKMTSEQFIEQTKDLSPAEFVSFFVEGSDEPLPTITDLYGNEFTPDPNQTIQYLAALMVKNPRLLSRFTREMKRHDKGMELIMDEQFNHPEFYSTLASGMSKQDEGRKRCHRIGRAMNDQYMEAIEKFVMEQKMNEEVQPKSALMPEDGGPMGAAPQNPTGMVPPKMKPQQGGAFGGGGMGGEIPPNAGMGGGMGGGGGPQVNGPVPGGAMGGGGAGGGMGGPGMPGGMPGADMPPGAGGMGGGPPPMPPTGMPGAAPPGLDMGNGAQPGVAPMPKLKGETAHGNMIEEMGGFPHMFAHMSDYCINCKDKKK